MTEEIKDCVTVSANLTEEECSSFNWRLNRRGIIHLFTVGFVCTATFAAMFLLKKEIEIYSFLLLIYAVYTLYQGATNIKKVKKQIARTNKEYTEIAAEWKIYENCFDHTISRGGKEEYLLSMTKDEIKTVLLYDDMYIFDCKNLRFCVPKRVAPSGSEMFNLLFPSGTEAGRKSKRYILQRWYELFEVLSYYALLFSVAFESLFLNSPWVFFIFAVFPTVQLILSLIAKKNRVALRDVAGKNVFAIVIIVLLIYLAM